MHAVAGTIGHPDTAPAEVTTFELTVTMRVKTSEIDQEIVAAKGGLQKIADTLAGDLSGIIESEIGDLGFEIAVGGTVK